MIKMDLMSQRCVKVLKITASIPNLLQVYDPSYHYSSHGSVIVLQVTSLQTAKKAASVSDANRERKHETNPVSILQRNTRKNFLTFFNILSPFFSNFLWAS